MPHGLRHEEDDRELVCAVLARAPGAFERLLRTHQALCWHIVLRMVRNPEDARELCQETFLRVYRRLHQYRFECALKTWIGRVAYHIALRHLERKRLPMAENAADEDGTMLVERIGDGGDLEASWMQQDSARHLHAAIEALPPTQRTVLTLYHLDELSIGEIASITGLADGTIKSHLFRGRQRLRQQLEPVLGANP